MAKRNLMVYIIESPSPDDVYNNVSEGDRLKELLRLSDVNCLYRRVADLTHFRHAVDEFRAHELGSSSPVLHISAHGSAEGIGLTSGERITWDELGAMLTPLNSKVAGRLVVCMSSCDGFSGCQMAMAQEGALPFLGIIGHSGKPTWGDTAVAFHTFYHLSAKGHSVQEAVKGMCTACGDNGFLEILAIDAKQAYLQQLEKGQAGVSADACQDLTSGTISQVPPLAKLSALNTAFAA